MSLYDITKGIMSAEVYPGDPLPRADRLASLENGDGCNLSKAAFCVHTGTHIDAPLHFIEKGIPVDSLNLELFCGECDVIEVPEGAITSAEVKIYFPHGYERVLIKSGGKAYFTESGAGALASEGIRLIGTDALSIGNAGDEQGPHTAFLSKGIPVLESLNLEGIKPGKYNLTAFPILLEGFEAAPVRAVLSD